MNLTKQEALKQIEKLKQYIEGINEQEQVGAYGVQGAVEYKNQWCVNGLGRQNAYTTPALKNATGYTFSTEEAAQRVAEALDVWLELCMQEGAEEFVSGKKQWTIYYDGEDFSASGAYIYHYHPLAAWFPSEELAQEAIANLGEEKLNKLFMIGE